MKRETPGRVRISAEAFEAGLSPLAQRSSASRGREHADDAPCSVRTPYQRDRDRIVHSKAFRRLKHKTQVFISPEGDHYRTRLTHTLEVSGIARTAARALRLNEDLTEAVALGHDLGHTPFGHAGEDALDAVLRDLGYAGFRHNEQSLRVVEVLEDEGRGLNLTWEVRDGILHHTGAGEPATLEAAIVRICDRVAYINHDIDDAVRAGLITVADLPPVAVATLGATGSERIDALVHDLVDESDRVGAIRQSPAVASSMAALRGFLFERVYPRSIEESGGASIRDLVGRLFHHLLEHPEKLPAGSMPPAGLIPLDDPALVVAPLAPGGDADERARLVRAVTDHVAGMTDRFAERVFFEWFVPRSWTR
ncbi:MAG: deoxyguanosinetriphosphate triphosphohydrolase [Actinobacteria bacterium]|nr:deoxyguanosinetriphosphate triphosphohydrolase [Actinomycetota bacterium]